MLGAALGRSLMFDQDVHQLYPMLNVLLIGPSGTGKSTAVKMAMRLLKSLPLEEQPQIIAGSGTPEKVHLDLQPNPHAILFASELANFLTKQKYMEGMIPYITELLDYSDAIERRTKSGGIVEIDQPSVTFIGCSTVDWLQDQLPDSATSGGFLARFLIVHEEHKGQNVALPQRALGRSQRLKLEADRARVFGEFFDLVNFHKGVIDFADYDAADIYTEWYGTKQPINGHLAPFAARAGEFVLRLSMLVALSCYRHSITRDDVRAGIQLYGWSERKLQQVVVPMTPQGKLLAKVLEAIGTEGRSAISVRRAMRNFCSAQDVDRLVESLVQSRDVLRTPEGKLVRVS